MGVQATYCLPSYYEREFYKVAIQHCLFALMGLKARIAIYFRLPVVPSVLGSRSRMLLTKRFTLERNCPCIIKKTDVNNSGQYVTQLNYTVELLPDGGIVADGGLACLTGISSKDRLSIAWDGGIQCYATLPQILNQDSLLLVCRK